MVLKGPWAEMEKRNLKNNILTSDLENLFNAYKEYLDFRAVSLKAQPKTDRGNNFNKLKDFGKNRKAKPQTKPFDLLNWYCLYCGRKGHRMDNYCHCKTAMAKGEPGYAKYKMENGIAVKKEQNAIIPIQASDNGHGVTIIKLLILRV